MEDDARPTTVVLFDGATVVASWPVDPGGASATGRLDLGVVDTLARLQLGAHRLGLSVELRHACPRLLALLDLVGLAGLATGGALPLQAGGEPEGGEQLRVQEAVEPGDQPL